MSNTPEVDPEIEAAIVGMEEHAVERGSRYDSTPVALAKFEDFCSVNAALLLRPSQALHSVSGLPPRVSSAMFSP